MRKKLLFSFLILALLGGSAMAQHPIVIEPMVTNPQLAEQHARQAKTLFPAGSGYYYFDDTLSLPFIDDFSKDRFKDFRLSQYTGIYQQTLYYFSTVNYSEQYPDSVWYLLNKPDSFIVTSADTFQVVPSTAPQFKIYIYDTLSNPFVIIDSVSAWPFIPKMIDVVNNVPVFDENFIPDGMLYNREKEYTMIPASPNDKSLWVDRHVYVSNSMAVKPPTIGTAVFDGINMAGMPYNYTPFAHGVADYLTSKPIDLAGYLPGDSLYLSFYVQPQGIGYSPATKDSLVLEFKAPDNVQWKSMWRQAGSSVQGFKHIRIPVKDAQWLVKGFQFRFKNYADLNANMDHWLLDYVRLDEGRNYNDTLINDFAFVSRAPSILINYEQMPAHQFTQDEVDQKWDMQTSNLWSTCKWGTYENTMFDESGTALTSYPASDDPSAIDTSCINTYYPGEVLNNNPRHYLPTFGYVFDVQDPNCCPYEDSVHFDVRHVVTSLSGGPGTNPTVVPDANTGNDTIYRRQTFYNFYAYDDGEAEASMYLGTAGNMAYEFELNFPDTLRAVQFYFNPQNPNSSGNTFELRIWQTLNNTTEDTVYSQAGLHPIYANWPNKFTTYILTRPVVLPAGKFYVGWRQTTPFKINIGWDRNIDRSAELYYKTTGQWVNTADLVGYNGALMLRPVLGHAVTAEDFMGIPKPEETAAVTVNVFPNPSTGLFYYDLSNDETPSDLEIQVLDLSGKVVYGQKASYERTLDLNHLSNGIYFTRFVSRSQSLVSIHKVIISK